MARTAAELGGPCLAHLADPDRLADAAHRATRGKRRRPDVASFWFRREAELQGIGTALREGTWRPEGFELLYLRDPKPRVIARAPVADRIVHAALARLFEPAILRSARAEDVGCRPGGGVHRAWFLLWRAMRRHRFALHLDVRAFFPSIDPALVLTKLGRFVSDRALLGVVEQVLESGRGLYDSSRARRHARLGEDWPPRGRGLPMGAATSQLFAAHLLLQGLDHRIKRQWKVPAYLRYVDDFFLFGDRRRELRDVRARTAEALFVDLDLRLKHPRAPVIPCTGTLSALGACVTRRGVEPSSRAWRRLRGRMGDHVRPPRRGKSAANLRRSLAGSAGWLYFPGPTRRNPSPRM